MQLPVFLKLSATLINVEQIACVEAYQAGLVDVSLTNGKCISFRMSIADFSKALAEVLK